MSNWQKFHRAACRGFVGGFAITGAAIITATYLPMVIGLPLMLYVGYVVYHVVWGDYTS